MSNTLEQAIAAIKHDAPNHPRGVGYNEGIDAALHVLRQHQAEGCLPTIIWKANGGRYSSTAINAYAGNVLVGTAFLNESRPKGSDLAYRATICLPDSSPTKDFLTEDEAKDYVETTVAAWFMRAFQSSAAPGQPSQESV